MINSRRLNLFTIPATSSFVDALADRLLKQAGDDPAQLAAMTILVPNRRAVRSLREAFLRRSNGMALLLPAIRPIGDVAEDELLLGGAELVTADIPPAIDPLRRQIILADWLTRSFKFTLAQGLATAAELARLIDSVHTEGLTLDKLDTLVAGDYAEHWKISLTFLNNVLRVFWPQRLAGDGVIDPALRRRLMIEAYTKHLQHNPPAGPVIGAGSTGSIPATAQLLKTIASLPNGQVVLPGLDLKLDDASWEATDEGHPQHIMRNLLSVMGATRADVKLWPGVSKGDGRATLISEIMRPAETTAAWQNLKLDGGFGNLTLLEADSLDQEAGSIALMMRDHAQKTTADTLVLVTPDRILAGRVGQILKRWDITVDDSAGVPLSHTPVGGWILTLAETWAQDFAPVPLLAVLKHALYGHDRHFVRDLDQYALRGVRPAPGIDGLIHRIMSPQIRDEDIRNRLLAQTEHLKIQLKPLLQRPRGSLALIHALVATAENLAATPDLPGDQRLWSGDDGEAAASLFAMLLEQGDILPDLTIASLSDLLHAAMSGVTVRPRYGTHPRLAILGPIESRLYQAETMILGSLNEGTWPALPEVDGWMSRPMRRDFNLPQPERAISLSAHDFCQGLGAGNVVLTRSKSRDGAPTTPARWLQRLDAVRDAADGPDIRMGAEQWLSIATRLDIPAGFARPAVRPEFNPPLADRFDRLSVTDIATLQRDPYAIYARYILNLRARDAIDAEPGAKDRGNLIHKVLEEFTRKYSGAWPQDALNRMQETGRAIFGQSHDHPDVLGHWWPRFERMVRTLAAHEATWRQGTRRIHTEVTGMLDIDIEGRNVRLKGRADRIESRIGNGYAIIDYKSGVSPSRKDVNEHHELQLTLLGAMLRRGAFDKHLGSAAPYQMETLSYWPVSGSRDTFSSIDFIENLDTLSDQSFDRLMALLRAYLINGEPFYSWPELKGLPRDNRSYDYAHLERMAEWRNETGGDEEDAA